MSRIILLGSLLLIWIAMPARTVSGADYQEVHTKTCARCHGENGKGDGPALVKMKGKALDWTDKAVMSKVTDEYLVDVTVKGGGAVGKSKLMPAYKNLDEKVLKEMVTFIRAQAK